MDLFNNLLLRAILTLNGEKIFELLSRIEKFWHKEIK